MGVATIDWKHVEGEQRLGRAIKRIISDKTVDHTGGVYYITRQHMEQLERAYDKTFAKPKLTKIGEQVMASFRRNTRKRSNPSK